MKVRDIISVIEENAPLSYQENYDNSGMQIGDIDQGIGSVLLTIDVTMDVVDEAIAKKTGLIISHHPLIFGGIRKITGRTEVEKIIIKAIQNKIAIYAAHTNVDNVYKGVNQQICKQLGLENIKIIKPIQGELVKLVTFVPKEHADKVRMAIFNGGAGQIGDYDQCSFNIDGSGTFRGGEDTDPFVGEKGKLHFENEVRIETIVPRTSLNNALSNMLDTHPYEEVAYDIYPLDNMYDKIGAGMIGELKKPIGEKKLFDILKKKFGCNMIRHSKLLGKDVSTIAVCGGAGSDLLKDAMALKADVFISGDFKYHQFFEAEDKIVIVDIGHFESEQFTKEFFYELLIKKFPKFAIHFSDINTNPINYY